MPTTGNAFLDSVPDDEYARIADALERHSLARGASVFDPYDEVRDVLFPVDAVISLTQQTERGEPIEVTMIGPEGLLGSWIALGVPWSPWWAVCQVEGEVWRVPATYFRDRLSEMPEMLAHLRRYELTQTFMMSQSILCNRFHDLPQRAARWLLLMQTKTSREPLPLTQEFFSQMLGAHRPSVTLALQTLSEAGLVENVGRGRIRILDPAGLEAVSCECFRSVEEFTRTVFDTPLTLTSEATSTPGDRFGRGAPPPSRRRTRGLGSLARRVVSVRNRKLAMSARWRTLSKHPRQSHGGVSSGHSRSALTDSRHRLMSESETARAAYLRAVIAALTDEVASGSALALSSRRSRDGALDVLFQVPDGKAFNARVSMHAELSEPTTEVAGD